MIPKSNQFPGNCKSKSAYTLLQWSHDDQMTLFESSNVHVIKNIHITANVNLEPR